MKIIYNLGRIENVNISVARTDEGEIVLDIREVVGSHDYEYLTAVAVSIPIDKVDALHDALEWIPDEYKSTQDKVLP